MSNRLRPHSSRATLRNRTKLTRRKRIACEALESRLLLTTLSFDPDGALGGFGTLTDVETFDLLPASSYSVNGMTGIQNWILTNDPVIGDGVPREFGTTLYGHAKVGTILQTGGGTVLPAGQELTVVTRVKEEITTVAGSTSVLSVVDDDSNFVELYFDSSADSNLTAGTGFNNGTLILKGIVRAGTSTFTQTSQNAGALDQFPSANPLDDNYPDVDSVRGLGSTQFTQIELVYVDPAFFKDPLGLIVPGTFASDVANPHENSNPSDAFVTQMNANPLVAPVGSGPAATSFSIGLGAAGIGIGEVNGQFGPGFIPLPGLGGPDTMFETDARAPFSVLQPDAKIEIAPDDTNEVGDPHSFTVTVMENLDDGSGFQPADNELVTVSLVNSNGATGIFNPDPDGGDLLTTTCTTDATGQCTVQIVSPTAGQVTATASSNVDVLGVPLPRSTDGIAPNSGPAVKTYVDAKIEITPDATNEVGDPHTFTVTVMQDDGLSAAQGGDGADGFTAAPVGNVDVTLTDTNGAVSVLDAAASTCDDNQPAGDNLDASGQCTTVFTSNSAGQVTGHATVELTVGGVTLTRETDGVAPNSDDAVKTFVDAKIEIAPDATNEVGDPHTFTVTVMQDDGLSAAQGGDGADGFTAAPVGNVDVTLTDTNGAVSVLDAAASTCDDNQPAGDNLDASGQCTTVFTSNSAGQVTGHATVEVTVGGITLTRETDGVAPNSDDAVKTFVDAKIEIAPDATNEVGDPHTFTVTVMQDDGLSAAQGGDGADGFTAAPVGNVDVTLTDTNGAVSVLDAAASTCDDNQPAGDNLDASGQCTTVFTSNSAGQVTGHATVELTVGGVTLTRETDGVAPNSDDAVKTFVDAKIEIAPDATNEVGDPHTFTVTVMQDDGLSAAQGGDGADGFTAAPVGNVDVTLTDTNGAVSVLDAAASTCDDNQPAGDNLDASGQCTTVFTSNSAGQVTGHATVELTVGGVTLTRETDGVAPNSDDAVKTFVDAFITIDPDGENPVGDPHTFTVTVMQDDGLSAAQGGDGADGFTPATVGNVDVTLTDSGGAVSVLDAVASTCDDNQPNGDNLDGSGQCTTVFTSFTPGQVDGHAVVELTVGGVTLTRETDGIAPNSDDAIKTFIDGGDGCTPGYWKNNAAQKDAVSWGPTGLDPDDALDTLFPGAAAALDTLGFGDGDSTTSNASETSLLEALNLRGGGVKALLRHAVAGALNALHPDVGYGIALGALVADVEAALIAAAGGDTSSVEPLKDLLAAENEAGCSIDQHGNPIASGSVVSPDLTTDPTIVIAEAPSFDGSQVDRNAGSSLVDSVFDSPLNEDYLTTSGNENVIHDLHEDSHDDELSSLPSLVDTALEELFAT